MKTNSSISFSFIGTYNWCLINANDAVLPPGAVPLAAHCCRLQVVYSTLIPVQEKV